MIARWERWAALASMLMISISAHAAGTSYSLIGDAAAPPPDPIGDSISTRRFDSPLPLDPLARHLDDAARPGDDGSFARAPEQPPQYSLSTDPAPPMTRPDLRMSRRLGFRIDDRGNISSDSADPRDRFNNDPSARVEGPRSAYDNGRR